MTDCFLFFSSPLPLLLLYFRSIHFCLRTVVAAEEKKKEKGSICNGLLPIPASPNANLPNQAHIHHT